MPRFRLRPLTLLLLAGLAWYAVKTWQRRGRDEALFEVPAIPKRFTQRIIALGDLHGDLPHTLRALRLAGLVNLRGQWIGKKAVLVQTGDIVDRGKDTIALYSFFDQLRTQAERAGGAVVSLLGNHEMMNAFGDWRYVTEEDIASFGGQRSRKTAMSADGWIGRTWSSNYSITARVTYADEFIAAPIDDTPISTPTSKKYVPPILDRQLTFRHSAASIDAKAESYDIFAFAAASFVHGGISPEWAARPDPIESMNEIGQSLLRKAISGPMLPMGLPRNTTSDERELYAERGPLWYRGFATEEDEAIVCEEAERVRSLLGVRRLIMGHTPNFEGIRSRCRGKVLLIDTGISRAYGGAISALEITYTLTPVIPYLEDGTEDYSATELRWRELEVVAALYEGRDKEVLVRSDRALNLPSSWTVY